ncbi:MAG TPA: response regulator [Ktedonobacteraceae bacterium]|nr:response regulator [Ktedonobacteraceae bacterium]
MPSSFPTFSLFCMVIDPSLVMRKVLEIELGRSPQYSCLGFADPLEAMQAIALQHVRVPDIALICWRLLPTFDGIDVLRHLKQAHYHTASVMLLDQDQGRPLNHLKAKLAGAQRTLVKPFTMEQLRASLASLKFSPSN